MILESKVEKINPLILLTKNRDDVLIRKEFLTDVIDNNKTPNQTLYYKFIFNQIYNNGTGDPDKKAIKYMKLYEDIKLNGIIKPIIIGKWPSGFQLMDGAHRLGVALYLNLDNIPVKVIPTGDFVIPDYGKFFRLKMEEYE